MKKVLLGLIAILFMAGCTKEKTKTYYITLNSGEKFAIILKTNDGYGIEQQGSSSIFNFTKDGEKIAQGGPSATEYYDSLYDEIKEDSYTSQYKRLDRDDAKIICYHYDDGYDETNACRIKPNIMDNEFIVMDGSLDDLNEIVDRLIFKK